MPVVFLCFFCFLSTVNSEDLEKSTYGIKQPLSTIPKETFFSKEQVQKLKYPNQVFYKCPFNNKKKNSTFACAEKKCLKKNAFLFFLWTSRLPSIYKKHKKVQKKEKIYTDADNNIKLTYKIKTNLNYVDITSFKTYCSFYKMYVSDLQYFSTQNPFHIKTSNSTKKDAHPYFEEKELKEGKATEKAKEVIEILTSRTFFIKTDHLNCDPLEEYPTIFIIGQNKKQFDANRYTIPYFTDKIKYWYMLFINKILNFTFCFISTTMQQNYIIYKNNIIYPFTKNISPKDKSFIHRVSDMNKKDLLLLSSNNNSQTNQDGLSDFYLVEICHSLKGITYQQTAQKITQKLSTLYFNIEFVPYIYHLPPVFYHIVIIVISSTLFSYYFYRLFLKFKKYI